MAFFVNLGEEKCSGEVRLIGGSDVLVVVSLETALSRAIWLIRRECSNLNTEIDWRTHTSNNIFKYHK